jgi:antitoxin (DNA-binding transcriptional repressor) of toxin-antitoxin stability system
MTYRGQKVAQYNMAQAKARFSELVQKALSGEEVILARDFKPLLRLVPLKDLAGERSPGSAKGEVHMSPDFDAPLEDFADYQ